MVLVQDDRAYSQALTIGKQILPGASEAHDSGAGQEAERPQRWPHDCKRLTSLPGQWCPHTFASGRSAHVVLVVEAEVIDSVDHARGHQLVS